MKRMLIFFSVAILLMTAIVTLGHGPSIVAAQDASKVHPIVGTWLVDTDPEGDLNERDVFQFRADGTYTSVEQDDTVHLGQWEAIDGTSVNLFILSREGDEDGNYLDTVIIRATFTVAADGKSLTAIYTFEIIMADGTSTGEIGPGTAIGDRITIEAQGTPVMTMDEAFAMFGEGEEATPVP